MLVLAFSDTRRAPEPVRRSAYGPPHRPRNQPEASPAARPAFAMKPAPDSERPQVTE